MSSSNIKQADDPNLVKLQALVNREEKLFLQSVHPERGWIVNSFNQFISALVLDCKNNGILHYTPENTARLDEFIRIRTSPELTKPRLADHATRTAPGLHKPTADLTDLPASPAQKAPRRGRGRAGDEKAEQDQKHKD